MELTQNPQIITLADSNELVVDFDAILEQLRFDVAGPPIRISSAVIDWIAGTPKVSSNGVTITSTSGGLSSSITRLLVPIERGVPLKIKGALNDSIQICIQIN